MSRSLCSRPRLASHHVCASSIGVLAPTAHPLHGSDQGDGAIEEAAILVGDEKIGVEREARAEPIAVRTHAMRAVEAEKLGAGRFIAPVAGGAGVTRAQ